MTTYYVDYDGGNDGNDGLSFANRKKLLSAAASLTNAGDTVRVIASPAPSALGVNVTWTDLSPTLTLASALTANISLCTAGWTASANVTTTTSSDRKEGSQSTSVAPAAAFTTGLAAYEAMGATDFSAYQGVSFWIKQTAGTVAIAGDASLRLCSDAAGVTTVNNIAIPGLVALNQWVPVYVDTAGALGAAIQSVALYIDTDRGAQTFLIDNIVAVKANGSDNLNLQSLIGKPNSLGSGGTDAETWYAIRSINGTAVILDMGPNSSAATASRGYSGTGETVAGWKRETTKTTMVAAAGTDVQTFNDSGSAGSLITVSGGWNRTDMSTQTDYTFYNGLNGLGDGLTSTGTFVAFSRLGFTRYNNGLNAISGADCTWTTITSNNNSSAGILSASGARCVWTTITVNNNVSVGLSSLSGANCTWTTVVANNSSDGINAISGANCTWTTVTANNNSGRGILSVSGTNCIWTTVVVANNSSDGLNTMSGANCTWTTVTANTNGASGLATLSGANCKWSGVSTAGNTTAGVSPNTATPIYFVNPTFADTTPIGAFNPAAFGNGKLFCKNYGAVEGDFRIYSDSANIQTDTSVRHTASGYSWKVNITGTDRSVIYPMELSLARIAVTDSVSYTVTVWTRRSHATQITSMLVVKGGQLNGVTEVTDTITVGADTWEQLSVTFTPTENGVIEITGRVYDGTGTTNSAYFDDLAVDSIAVTLDYQGIFTGPGPDPLVAAGAGGMVVHPGMTGGMRG